ncbi:MAG: hypothetical protein JXB32_13870 [Deltaproteobacteria bacterium]|nr:hypothetical protein [Deltaproteobacteria bacterium]
MGGQGAGWITIVNGTAGHGRAGRRAPAELERLQADGLTLDVRRTERPGHAAELAREAYAAGARRFLAVGGDGTAFEVLNGIFPRPAGHDDPVVLAQLPLGTGNSFLRDFDLCDVAAARATLVRDRRRRVDVIRAEHRDGELHYINLLSIGFSAEVGALTNRRFKPLGHAGYGLAVVLRVAGLRHPVFRVCEDGGPVDERPCTLLSFSNSRYTGGTMMMAPHAEVDDGRLQVVRVGRLGRWGLLRAFPKIYKGTHVRLAAVEERRAATVEFRGERELDVMVDGEVLRLALRRLEVLPGALEVPA